MPSSTSLQNPAEEKALCPLHTGLSLATFPTLAEHLLTLYKDRLVSCYLSYPGGTSSTPLQRQLSVRPDRPTSDDTDEAEAQLAAAVPSRKVWCFPEYCQSSD